MFFCFICSLFNNSLPPVQGVPPPAKRLSCGRQCYGLPFRYAHGSYLSVVSAPLTPLRAAVPCACSHRFGGSTACLSRQPHKASCCHSPLRSPTGVANTNELLQLLPRCRALTTTFSLRRADDAGGTEASSARSAFSPLSGRWLYHRLKALL